MLQMLTRNTVYTPTHMAQIVMVTQYHAVKLKVKPVWFLDWNRQVNLPVVHGFEGFHKSTTTHPQRSHSEIADSNVILPKSRSLQLSHNTFAYPAALAKVHLHLHTHGIFDLVHSHITAVTQCSVWAMQHIAITKCLLIPKVQSFLCHI